jgi:hypothetical protein
MVTLAKSTVLIDCHVTTSKLNPTFTEVPGLFCVFGPVCEPSSPTPTVPMPQAQTSHSALAAIHESISRLKQRETVRLQLVQDRHASDEQDQKFQ